MNKNSDNNSVSYYYTSSEPVQKDGNGMAIASLVLGIVSLCCCTTAGIVGLILGIIAKKREPDNKKALAGIICSSIGIVWSIVAICIMIFSGAMGTAALLNHAIIMT